MYVLASFIPTRNASDLEQLRASLHAKDFTDLYIALYKHFTSVRGHDPATVGKGTLYPATTNLDVMQLAAMWTREVLRVDIDDDTDRARHKGWLHCLSMVEAHADIENHPDAVYSRNTELWRCMSKTAIWLDTRKLRPSKWDMWWDSVDEAIDDLPGTLAGVAKSAGSAGSSAVDAAGSAAKTVGRGVSSFLSEPVRLIALLVGGAILIPPMIRAMRD